MFEIVTINISQMAVCELSFNYTAVFKAFFVQYGNCVAAFKLYLLVMIVIIDRTGIGQ
jgi:hypothetical protein